MFKVIFYLFYNIILVLFGYCLNTQNRHPRKVSFVLAMILCTFYDQVDRIEVLVYTRLTAEIREEYHLYM